MHGAVKSYGRCLYVVCCHHSFCYLRWLIYVGKSGLQKTKKRTWQEKRKAAFSHRRRFGRIRQAYEGQGRDSGRFRRRGIEEYRKLYREKSVKSFCPSSRFFLTYRGNRLYLT